MNFRKIAQLAKLYDNNHDFDAADALTQVLLKYAQENLPFDIKEGDMGRGEVTLIIASSDGQKIAKKGELGPQNVERLILDVLINVFHETPDNAKKIYDREMRTHSIRTEPDKDLLFSSSVYIGDTSGKLESALDKIFQELEQAISKRNSLVELIKKNEEKETKKIKTFKTIKKKMNF